MQALPALLDDALQRISAGPLCVGFSGGLDSTVLLHALAASPAARARGLRAWHVHHGLHAEADRWAAGCEATCAALGVPLTVTRVEVARDTGHGPEAAARQARHASFREGLGENEILVFAHHRDDQAETFLLRAMRASGPDGLGAMREWRGFGRGHLWRPLLGIARASLEAYANELGLRWIEDPSNADVSFDRNFLRREVLPLLGERWPHAAASLARSAELCAEAAVLLDADDSAALVGVVTDDPASLSRTRLAGLSPPQRARVLRHWIATLGLSPLPANGIARVESELLAARPDATACFEWHGAMIHAWRDVLHAGRVLAPLPDGWQVEWDGVEPLVLPDSATLALRPFVGAASAANREAGGFGRSLLVRARRGGERITLASRAHSHSLKQVLQERAIPPWQRTCLPLLSTMEGELLAAGDRILSASFEQWLHERGACLQWHLAPSRPRAD
ncbi:tRNA lysidine(34) synthetase TilS [Novilysobacter erysipheiresistens]|uniref:tRNA(Ile)-lysidine synthase n=1 Tax=Novilysobacter erysipheiresistens TaxID=1749332 RepID=A0ABU7YUU9_9GAMM